MPPIRKKMKRRQVRDGIRFLTFSCYERQQLLGTERLRDHFAHKLEDTRRKFGILLIAWVAMPEHVHLLLRPPRGESDIVPALTWLKRTFARDVIARWRALRAPVLPRLLTPSGRYQYWQDGGGYDRHIFSHDELVEKATYIHKNPVARSLVEHSYDWRWSSARWYRGIRDGIVTIDLTAWETPDIPPSWWTGEGSRPPDTPPPNVDA